MVSKKDKNKAPEQTGYSTFEEATKMLYDRKYEKALDLFQQVKSAFAHETEVTARADTFIKVCESHLQEDAKPPDQAEGLFDLGVVHHNAGSHNEALQCFADALQLEEDGKSDYIYYAMAATENRLGNTDKALKNLKKAIQIRVENRFFAQSDPDFENLRNQEEFQRLISQRNPK